MTSLPAVGPDEVASAVVAVVASVFLISIGVGVIKQFQTKNEQRLLTAIALPEGLWIGAGISPDGRIATAMARSFEIVPSAYRSVVLVFLGLSTIGLLIVGGSRMGESGGWTGVTAFFFVFFGAVTLSSSVPVIGFFAIVAGLLLTELAPSRSAWGRR